MTARLLLARHGSVETAHTGFLGSTDVPLSPQGRREAFALAETLRGRGVEGIVCSPMERAMETAQIIAGVLRLPVEQNDDLREFDFGEWEGMFFHQIRAEYPAQTERWASFAPDFAPPGGEDLGAFLERVKRTFERLRDDSREALLAVTHGGVIRQAICLALGLSASQYLLFDIQPASLTTLRIFGQKGLLQEIRNADIEE